MTTHIAAVIILSVVSGLAQYVQDTLLHHWSSSRFKRWAKGSVTHFWGQGDSVWLRRYVDNDPAKGKKWPHTNPFLALLVEPFADGWHLAKTVQIVCFAGISSILGPWWLGLVVYSACQITFIIFYNKVR